MESKPRSNRPKLGWIILLAMGLSGCSLGYEQASSVKISFEFNSRNKTQSNFGLNPFLTAYDHDSTTSSMPPQVSAFDCLAVNIVGRGIPTTHWEGDAELYIKGLEQGSYCSYRGVTSRTIPLDQRVEMELSVPSGANRFIQVLGFTDPNRVYCNSSLPIGQVDEPKDSQVGIYVVGQERADLFRSQTVTVNNKYDSMSSEERGKTSARCYSGDGSGSGNIDPKSFSDLKLWLSAGTFAEKGLANDTQIVIAWEDKSGFGGNGAGVYPTPVPTPRPQPSATPEPWWTYPKFKASGGPNNQPYVHFQGNYFQELNSGLGDTITGLTIFVVGQDSQPAGSTNNRDFLALTGDSVNLTPEPTTFLNYDFVNLGFSGASGNTATPLQASFSVGRTDTTADLASISPTSGFKIYTAVRDTSASTIQYGSTTTNLADTNSLNLNGMLLIGWGKGFGWGGSVDIAEIIVYARTLSASEISSVNKYLQSKYGNL